MKQKALNPQEHLEALQSHDVLRAWKSLNEKRRCVCCNRKFPGSHIVVRSTQEGELTFCCPTRNCPGSLRDFVFPGNPLSDERSWADWLRTLELVEGLRAAKG